MRSWFRVYHARNASLVEAIDGLAAAVTLLAERFGLSQPAPSPCGRGRHLMRGLEGLRMELCSHAHRTPSQPPDGSCP